MAKSHKAQHWIPKSYLRAWVDPDTPSAHEPFVHVYSRDGKQYRRKAPANLFDEVDLYTIKLPNGVRNLRLERGLAGLETAFAIIRKDYLTRRRQLPTAQRFKLIAFVVAMYSRTPSIRDHHMKHWREVQGMMEDLEKRSKTASPDELAAMSSPPSADGRKSMTLDDVRRVISSPMEYTLGPYFASELPHLLNMRCAVLCTPSDPGFITSDAPVVWFNPEWHKKPPMFQSPSLSDPLLEISMPVSPSQMLILSHQAPTSRQHKIEYIDAPDYAVEELNRRTRFGCDKEFVLRRKTTHPRWFEVGEVPTDAWEVVHGKQNKS